MSLSGRSRQVAISFGVIITVLVVLLVVAARTGLLERLFLYFPERELEADPGAVGLPFEDVELSGTDGTGLHGWYVPGENDTVVVWFHGNAGNISGRIENLRRMREELGVSILLFDYRGYGRSSGTPSENGMYTDGEAMAEYAASRAGRLVYFGRSLGANIAIEVARRHMPDALILEAPFPSVPYMARKAYPFIPIWPLLGARYDGLTGIAAVNAPVLILHGDADEIVPFSAGQRIFLAADEPKTFHRIVGAHHNDTHVVGGDAYWTALRSFLTGLE